MLATTLYEVLPALPQVYQLSLGGLNTVKHLNLCPSRAFLASGLTFNFVIQPFRALIAAW